MTWARANNLTPTARDLARRSTYMLDRESDLRDVMLEQLDADLRQLEDELVADFPERAREAGIAESRIAAVSPRKLLRDLEQGQQATRHLLSEGEGKPKRVHWTLAHPDDVQRPRRTPQGKTGPEATRRSGLRQHAGNPLLPEQGVAAALKELSEVRVKQQTLENELQGLSRRIAALQKRITRAGFVP